MGVDYWAVGILIYEMLAGISPFADEYGEDQIVVCKKIVNGKPDYAKLEKIIRSTERKPTSGSAYIMTPNSPLGKNEPPVNGRRPVEDLLRRLFMKSPHQRIGCLSGFTKDIKCHPFYAISIRDWKLLRRRTFGAPLVPTLKNKYDISYFENYDFEEPLYPQSPRRHHRHKSAKDPFAAF